MTFRAVVLTGLLAVPVGAMADTPEESQNACFEASAMAGKVLPCVPEAAEACLQTIPGYGKIGADPAAITECIAPVAAWWDHKATAEYERVLAAYLEMEGGNGGVQMAPDRSEALKALQAAWLAYRDAKCANEVAGFGIGAGAPMAAESCRLWESAEHAVYLSGRGKPGPF